MTDNSHIAEHLHDKGDIEIEKEPASSQMKKIDVVKGGKRCRGVL